MNNKLHNFYKENRKTLLIFLISISVLFFASLYFWNSKTDLSCEKTRFKVGDMRNWERSENTLINQISLQIYNYRDRIKMDSYWDDDEYNNNKKTGDYVNRSEGFIYWGIIQQDKKYENKDYTLNRKTGILNFNGSHEWFCSVQKNKL